MNKDEFYFKPLWVRDFDEPVYASSIANLMGTQAPQVLGISYSRILRAFDFEGKEVFKTPFLSDITQFMASSLTDSNQIALISGDTHGYVRAIDLQGKLLWKRKLGAPILCMDIGDVAGDPKKEVIVGLENDYFALLDHEGVILFITESPQPILDVTLGQLPEEPKKSMIILSQKGEIAKVDFKKQWSPIITLKMEISCFTFIKLGDIVGFLVGTKLGDIYLVDIHGKILCHYNCKKEINDIAKFELTQDGVHKIYCTTSAGNELFLFQLRFPITKYLKGSKEKLESLLKGSTPFPSSNSDVSTISTGKLKCHECGKYLPKLFMDRIINGDEAYCELCGAKLSLSDIIH